MGLTNSQYDEIIREYNKKQLENKHQLDKRVSEVYSRSPGFQEIDNQISSLSIAQARKLLSGDKNAVPALKEKITELTRKRADLLASFGYAQDYLEMHYSCTDCQDTGYINNQKCHCFKQATINMLYSYSNLQEIIQEENFERFSYEYYSNESISNTTGLSELENIQKTVAKCQSFVQNFDHEFSNLFIYGNTGVGKTFLSNCIAKELIDSYHSVIYFTAFQLFDLFAKSTFSKEEELTDIYEHVFNCDLLIIDDLGTEMTNSFVSSQLFLCLNERLLRKKSTVISTNLPLDIFAETYSERIFSRISSNYTMLKIVADDIRVRRGM